MYLLLGFFSDLADLFRRHYPPCPHTSRRYRRCNCPLWVQGSLGGEWIKKSLNLTSWEAASDLVTGWATSGQVGVVRAEIPPLKEAIEKFIADAKAQQLNWETIRKYETFLDRRFLAWCETQGYRLLKQITPSVLADFRKTWEDSALYAVKNIERLRSFFSFCERMKWTRENPALALKPPKVTTTPTLPFTDAQMKKLLAACDAYRGDKVRIAAKHYSPFRGFSPEAFIGRVPPQVTRFKRVPSGSEKLPCRSPLGVTCRTYSRCEAASSTRLARSPSGGAINECSTCDESRLAACVDPTMSRAEE